MGPVQGSTEFLVLYIFKIVNRNILHVVRCWRRFVEFILYPLYISIFPLFAWQVFWNRHLRLLPPDYLGFPDSYRLQATAASSLRLPAARVFFNRPYNRPTQTPTERLSHPFFVCTNKKKTENVENFQGKRCDFYQIYPRIFGVNGAK